MHCYQKGPLDDRNGCDVADEIEIEVVIESRVDRGSSIRTKERIAIGGRTNDGLGGDIAGGASPVLDDEWLTEPLRERLTHQAYEDVRSAARGISNDAAKRPRRIGLRPRNAGHGRQRRSARGQMQKSTARKFHGSSFPAALCAKRLRTAFYWQAEPLTYARNVQRLRTTRQPQVTTIANVRLGIGFEECCTCSWPLRAPLLTPTDARSAARR